VALAIELHHGAAPFNRIAESYNAYVSIDPRIQDLKALKRMDTAWHALEKSQGWPPEETQGYQVNHGVNVRFRSKQRDNVAEKVYGDESLSKQSEAGVGVVEIPKSFSAETACRRRANSRKLSTKSDLRRNSRRNRSRIHPGPMCPVA
jgi:hypothetical protein